MKKMSMLYEGKAKQVYLTDNPHTYIISYKDDATAFDGLKKANIQGKGNLNNKISNHIMSYLEQNQIPTHLIEEISETDTLVKKVTIIPLEVIIRNVAAGSICKRLGLTEGKPLLTPILEFCYKNDELHDPLVNNYHILTLQLASNEDIRTIANLSFQINHLLLPFFKQYNVDLIDFKLEFGKTDKNEILLADEISPDTCRFWDSETKDKLDKDRFRRDMADVTHGYNEIARRLGIK